MLNTKLILVEGPPGSGKSTTAQNLAQSISAAGHPCQCFLEWSPDHPIPIGDDLHLGQVISTSLARESEMLAMWQQFAQARQTRPLVTVLESRFWQTSLMLMYVAGLSVEGVLASNHRVIQVIQALNPVLIDFAIDELGAFSARTIQLKNEEWQRAHFPGTWDQHLYAAFDGQPWFTRRGLSGLPGMIAFLEEWSTVAEKLYAQFPFPKIQIRNPHKDWALAMWEMQGFLGLD